ncbi:MAG: hypothetical protein ACWA5R_15080 [bacterium]
MKFLKYFIYLVLLAAIVFFGWQNQNWLIKKGQAFWEWTKNQEQSLKVSSEEPSTRVRTQIYDSRIEQPSPNAIQVTFKEDSSSEQDQHKHKQQTIEEIPEQKALKVKQTFEGEDKSATLIASSFEQQTTEPASSKAQAAFLPAESEPINNSSEPKPEQTIEQEKVIQSNDNPEHKENENTLVRSVQQETIQQAAVEEPVHQSQSIEEDKPDEIVEPKFSVAQVQSDQEAKESRALIEADRPQLENTNKIQPAIFVPRPENQQTVKKRTEDTNFLGAQNKVAKEPLNKKVDQNEQPIDPQIMQQLMKQLQSARELSWKGNSKQAEQKLSELFKQNPLFIPAGIELVQVLVRQSRFKEVEKVQLKIQLARAILARKNEMIHLNQQLKYVENEQKRIKFMLNQLDEQRKQIRKTIKTIK